MKSVRLGRVRGLELKAHPSAFLGLALLWAGAGWLARRGLRVGWRTAVFTGFVATGLHLAATLAHHAGHAAAAAASGFPMRGVRLWGVLGALASLLAFAAIGATVMWRSRRATGTTAALSLPFAFATVSLLSTLFAPFFLVPGLAVSTAVAFMVSVRAGWKMRGMINTFAGLAVGVPWLLMELDVIPRTYRFVDGTIQLLPNLVEFPAMPTEVLVIFTSLFVVYIPTTLVGRAVEELRRAERRRVLQSQRLRSMLPGAR
ncbi:MAG: hypothetical protein KDE45_05460 [Caldilineaceae bacterium]|nr:hypothetical protein [Caldilineaceae bacterium]